MTNKFQFKEGIISFIVWPIFSLFLAIKNYNKNRRVSSVLILLFFLFFGFNFIVGEEGGDALAYVDYVEQMGKKEFPSFDEGNIDFVFPFIYYLISRISLSHSFIFLIFSLIFGSLLLINLNLFIDKSKKINLNILVIIFYFLAILPISLISHIRWYTAFLFFLLGLQKLIFNEKKSSTGFFYIIFSPLIHFSFSIFSILSILFLYIPHKKYLFYILVILSFFFQNLLSDLLGEYLGFSGEVFVNRVATYNDVNFKELIKENNEAGIPILSIYVSFSKFSFLLAIILFDLFSKTKSNIITSNICFCLLIISIVNFGSDIYSFSSRFILLFFISSLFFLRNIYYNGSKTFFFSSIIVPSLLVFVIVQSRIFITYANLKIFLPLIILDVFNFIKDVSLLELIK